MGWLDGGKFDYGAFRREYAALAAMSEYERCNWHAEREKARKRSAADRWWMQRDYWKDAGQGHSVVEEAAIENVLRDCIQTVEARAERRVLAEALERMAGPVQFCVKCGQWKRRNHANFHSDGAGGLHSVCRLCRNEQARQYWHEHTKRQRLEAALSKT